VVTTSIKLPNVTFGFNIMCCGGAGTFVNSTCTGILEGAAAEGPALNETVGGFGTTSASYGGGGTSLLRLGAGEYPSGGAAAVGVT